MRICCHGQSIHGGWVDGSALPEHMLRPQGRIQIPEGYSSAFGDLHHRRP